MISFLLQFFVVMFSMFAGMFWMASAYGHAVKLVWPPWKPTSLVVLPSERPAHQAKWNGRAALCASIAAIAQALFFINQYYVNLPVPPP
jgi:hypothetical protein